MHIDTDASEVDIFDPRWDHNAFAGALKLFLRELPEPLLTYDLYSGFVSASSKLMFSNFLLSVSIRFPDFCIKHNVLPCPYLPLSRGSGQECCVQSNQCPTRSTALPQSFHPRSADAASFQCDGTPDAE